MFTFPFPRTLCHNLFTINPASQPARSCSLNTVVTNRLNLYLLRMTLTKYFWNADATKRLELGLNWKKKLSSCQVSARYITRPLDMLTQYNTDQLFINSQLFPASALFCGPELQAGSIRICLAGCVCFLGNTMNTWIMGLLDPPSVMSCEKLNVRPH